MKKIILFVLSLSLLLISGCLGSNPKKLNTSILKSISETKNEKGEIGLTEYEAPTLKDGLKSLPFKVKLPHDFPFDFVGYLPPVIYDLDGDRKKLLVMFNTTPIAKEGIGVIVKAYYPKDEVNGEPDTSISSKPRYSEVELKNGVVGRLYNSDNVFFDIDDVTYSVYYLDFYKSDNQVYEDIIDIANQMF
ncbi:hypothetical protein KHA96_18505 [Bacillus sp. FJAT-49711]|uniref:hypothetical protein n=1 Tax=Bacillus sp. FJAT-49711 TaxID=2833585 RepID=UPI001BC954C5|nr:hypothetical protein [Bacillus sp. FJAT-49711]MBS4220297.1 hypothetical protein [Bacillus sp. FJAT-49711]